MGSDVCTLLYCLWSWHCTAAANEGSMQSAHAIAVCMLLNAVCVPPCDKHCSHLSDFAARRSLLVPGSVVSRVYGIFFSGSGRHL